MAVEAPPQTYLKNLALVVGLLTSEVEVQVLPTEF
jgi:hypothetical protein